MKKKIAFAFLIAGFLFVLSGCGCRHEWLPADCVNPQRCALCGKEEAAALGHFWLEATCTTPKNCSLCGLEQGSAPGHRWVDETCTTPRICSRCGVESAGALGHAWVEETKTTPKMCTRCREAEPMAMPKSGQIFIGKKQSGQTNLTIKCSTSESYYVKLKNSSMEDIFSFFVPAGETVSISVPKKNCYVYFASGRDWYGPELLFGKSTSYSKDNELIDFGSYAITYTLIPTTYGNFSETPISADAF